MQRIVVEGKTRQMVIEYDAEDRANNVVRIDGVMVSVEVLETMFERSTEPGRWLRFRRDGDHVTTEQKVEG